MKLYSEKHSHTIAQGVPENGQEPSVQSEDEIFQQIGTNEFKYFLGRHSNIRIRNWSLF